MNSELKFYWKITQRRLPAMAALFLICTITAVMLAIRMPAVYQTSAELLVEDSQIASPTGTDNDNAGAQLEIIEQRLMTRANLIDIANLFDVFGEDSDLSPDEVVQQMRESTSIRRLGGRDRATLMMISFEGKTPQIVASVVNQYVTLILEENNRLSTGRAKANLAFFQQEVERLGRDLDNQSSEILKFKNTNSDALPDGMDYRLNRTSLLQERLARLERNLQQLNSQRESIIKTFEATGGLRPDPEAELSPRERQLQELQNQLTDALAVYSETNPRVLALKARIKQLETSLAEQSAPTDSEAPADAQQSLYEVTLAQLGASIASVQSEINATAEEIEELNIANTRTAGNEIALEALERRHENIQAQYNEAVARLSAARMEERIIASARGQRITVIEQATVPNSPASPNRLLIVASGIAGGLGLALGLFFLLEVLNRTVRRPEEVINKLGITPLATIPYMESNRDKFLRRSFQVATLLTIIIVIPAMLWMIDTYYQPIDLLMTRVLARLGIG